MEKSKLHELIRDEVYRRVRDQIDGYGVYLVALAAAVVCGVLGVNVLFTASYLSLDEDRMGKVYAENKFWEHDVWIGPSVIRARTDELHSNVSELYMLLGVTDRELEKHDRKLRQTEERLELLEARLKVLEMEQEYEDDEAYDSGCGWDGSGEDSEAGGSGLYGVRRGDERHQQDDDPWAGDRGGGGRRLSPGDHHGGRPEAMYFEGRVLLHGRFSERPQDDRRAPR